MATLAVLIIALLIVLIVLRVPVSFAILISGIIGLLFLVDIPAIVGTISVVAPGAVQSFSLSAIPLFIFMAHLMLLSGLVENLFGAARGLLGRAAGGTGIASVLAGVAFAAVSGSSTASAATLAKTTSIKMIEEGYRPTTATGIVASVGTLAGMIPPSIILVFYAITAEASVGDLIVAGIVPGIIIAVALIITMYVSMLWDKGSVPAGERVPWKEKLSRSTAALPIILIFGAVMGSIYFGIATPTEAAALGVLAALVLVVARRKFTWGGFIHALMDTVKTSSMIFAIIIGAMVFGHFLTETKVTDGIVAWVESLTIPTLIIMFAIMVFYVILGFFMDQAAIVALTVPVMLPVVSALGYNEVWFGVFVVLMGEIGLISPPLGLNVFVVARTAGRSIGEVFRGSAPYAIAMFLVGFFFLLFPEVVLWLPETMK